MNYKNTWKKVSSTDDILHALRNTKVELTESSTKEKVSGQLGWDYGNPENPAGCQVSGVWFDPEDVTVIVAASPVEIVITRRRS